MTTFEQMELMKQVKACQIFSVYANQLSDHSQREKGWLCTDLDKKERFLQEDRTRSLQEVEELEKLCCAEA